MVLLADAVVDPTVSYESFRLKNMGSCESFPACLNNQAFYATSNYIGSFKLPGFAARVDTLTVSGFSGGSNFVAMLTILYPDWIKGTAMMNGALFGAYGYDGNIADNAMTIATQK